jgi:hypothetical protein
MSESQMEQKSQIAPPREPDDTEFVLVNGEMVWQRDDMASESGGLDEEHWWLLDGGNWRESPVKWETLWKDARVIISLEVTDIIYDSRKQGH